MQPCIVIDNGAHQIKVGFAGENGPRILVPTVISRPNSKWRQNDGWYVGEEAKALGRHLPSSCPISNGAIINLDDWAVILQFIYAKQLRTNPIDHAVLFTEHAGLPKQHRAVVTELLFEKFGIPAVYFSPQSVQILYTSGLSSGLTVDIGHDLLSVVPVCETYSICDATKQCNVGGRHVTDYMHRLLNSSNPTVSPHLTVDVVEYFKEQLGHVVPIISPDLIALTDARPIRYRAPDGQMLAIGSERFFAPELFFRPDHGAMDCTGISHTIVSAIRDSPSSLTPMLYNNIVLSGGSTLFPGLSERLQLELSRLAPVGQTVRVVSPKERRFSVWIGGSILSSLNTFSKIWVTRQEYEEFGSDVVNRKCA